MENKSIEKELKLSKKQNKIERYDYLCSSFNAIDYCVNLEKYTNKMKFNLTKENTNLKQALNEIREIINGEQFFLLMNSQLSKDKAVCEDYFKGKELISKIIDKVLGGNG